MNSKSVNTDSLSLDEETARELNDSVFSEKIFLIRKNHNSGLLAFVAFCTVIAYIVYIDTKMLSALVWLAVILAFSAFLYIRFKYFHQSSGTQREANTFAFLATLQGIIFSYCGLEFLPHVSLTVFAFILIAYSASVSGSIIIESVYPPLFYGFNFPFIISIIITSLIHDKNILVWVAIGAVIYMSAMVVFALNTKKTITKSIELQFENHHLVKKLREALIETDDANRAKSVFLASASHDLRQPLHAIGLLTETLNRTQLNEEQTHIQSHIISAVDSTQSILDSLLNISKLDAGAITASPKPFLVQSMFQKLESELASLADENQLVYRTRETIAAANSDPIIVELILRNLIANAIRYTHNGGLLIACRNVNDALSLEVWDTGIGIPKDKFEELFKEFKQLDNAERDSQKGFGLGLAIAQGLAKTLDSKITVNSSLGKGSVFKLQLPKSSTAVIDDLPKKAENTSFTGKNVVVIDDDYRVRLSMHRLMEKWGCNCISGESAEQIIEQMTEIKVDLLLVDYRLRESQTGKGAIEAIRAHLNSDVPAIIITGDTTSDRISEAQACDALLLHKPTSTSQLKRIMASILNSSE